MPRKDWKKAPPKERATKIAETLAKEYEPVSGLTHRSAFELLIATILSAQCTDKRVNTVTPELFHRYPNAQSLASATTDEVEALVRSTGFYRQKTKSILAVSQALAEKYDGEVPPDIDRLTELPGVGRKTANVVLGTVFDQPAITVDTHVKRLSGRLKFSRHTDPDKIEQDLIAIIPAKKRTAFSHRLVWHGRNVCVARKPRCEDCVIAKYCPSENIV